LIGITLGVQINLVGLTFDIHGILVHECDRSANLLMSSTILSNVLLVLWSLRSLSSIVDLFFSTVVFAFSV
jgi:hypothetical protein